jgi:hypothetical protein
METTYVTPIPKNNNLTAIKNYHQIFIISILPKTFKDLVSKKLTPVFKNILVDNQHGFRINRLIHTNLITFYYNIIICINDNNQANVINTAFAKLFDRVNHFLPSQKLNSIGIGNPMLFWITSFIIKYKHFLFHSLYISSYIPQNFQLSPLLFNIFINYTSINLRFAK